MLEHTLEGTRIAFVGSGAMGSAIINGLFAAGSAQPSQIVVSDPSPMRQQQMAAAGVTVAKDNIEAVTGAQIVLFAIKPQMANKVLRELQTHIAPDALVISILAGTPISTFAALLNEAQPIVRVMPNLPAQINQGMSGWTCSPTVSPVQREYTRIILKAMGEEIYFDDEHYIDLVTGVSGSGPGFVFLLMEACIDGAVRAGLPRPTAEKLVIQTFKGAALYAASSSDNVVSLRHQVTSAGGTTAAGLHEMELGAVRATLANAVMAAYQRSVALGQPK